MACPAAGFLGLHAVAAAAPVHGRQQQPGDAHHARHQGAARPCSPVLPPSPSHPQHTLSLLAPPTPPLSCAAGPRPTDGGHKRRRAPSSLFPPSVTRTTPGLMSVWGACLCPNQADMGGWVRRTLMPALPRPLLTWSSVWATIIKPVVHHNIMLRNQASPSLHADRVQCVLTCGLSCLTCCSWCRWWLCYQTVCLYNQSCALQ